jgi:hypothetical protein
MTSRSTTCRTSLLKERKYECPLRDRLRRLFSPPEPEHTHEGRGYEHRPDPEYEEKNAFDRDFEANYDRGDPISGGYGRDYGRDR